MHERIKIILTELGLRQTDFAKELGITVSYVNMLLSGKRSTISVSLANLIQERYGYSSEWIIYNTGDKHTDLPVTKTKQEIIDKIKRMSPDEVRAVLAYVRTLETIKQDE